MRPEHVKRYVEDTGNTWYKPTEYEKAAFEKAKEANLLSEEDGYYTLPRIKREEEVIAIYAAIKSHSKEREYPANVIDIFIAQYEKKEKISLDVWQKDAVYQAMNHNIFILTGGPGTGKTCVLKCINYCLKKVHRMENILFTAPTGKAARRITESVKVPAMTVAKALHLTSEDSVPKKLDCDAVIVDEISMLDTRTCKALFEATLNAKLILVGDVDQLPSVGYGSILRDLIDAGLPCTMLEKRFRQASESGLVANIEQVGMGLNIGFIERDDFAVYDVSSEEDAKNIMVEQFLEAIKTYGMEQVVCLTPYRKKGHLCSNNLNRILQDKLNPMNGQNYVRYKTTDTEGFEYTLELREGDPVMQLQNADKVANGDVGFVDTINPEKETVVVDYQGMKVTYFASNLGQLTLAYAMSVHKSQGSEYDCVITSALSSDMEVLSRNTIYTAITRAKKKCVVVTQKDVAQKACKRESGYERVTRLAQQINRQQLRLELTTKLCFN